MTKWIVLYFIELEFILHTYNYSYTAIKDIIRNFIYLNIYEITKTANNRKAKLGNSLQELSDSTACRQHIVGLIDKS